MKPHESLAMLVLALTCPAFADHNWRNDPAWDDGKAEWALYEASRPIYGVQRTYEATIYTNKQRMDPETTTKASDWRDPDAIEVFKHNVSEMIPTERYTYRFLTTSFIRTADLQPYKLAMSSQEDCGTTYKQFTIADGEVTAQQFCYFPDAGESKTTFSAPEDLTFHDALSLTLRDYPFEDDTPPTLTLSLVADQTDTHETALKPVEATVEYAGAETVDVPYGTLDVHHLLIRHPRDGGVAETHCWFAADAALRHVMVQYEGPYGVQYRLKDLGWWAYWDRDAEVTPIRR